MIEIKDYSDIQENFDELYGGQAGDKKRFIEEDGSAWFIKFPKNTKQFQHVNLLYTTSPLSEYLGSKIYELFNLPVHETKLGTYKNKLVVVCKDFRTKEDKFNEMNEILNIRLDDYVDTVESLSSANQTSRSIDLKKQIFMLFNNPYLADVAGVPYRFFTMFVIDAFISNNDRHNGNWGVLRNTNTGEKILAPIYDNGNSFYNKHDEQKIKRILHNPDLLHEVVYKFHSIYYLNGENINPFYLLKHLDQLNEQDHLESLIKQGLTNSLKMFSENFDFNKIKNIFNEIPENINGIDVLPSYTKEFYLQLLEKRWEEIFSLYVKHQQELDISL